MPTFLVDWNARGLRARMAFGELAGGDPYSDGAGRVRAALRAPPGRHPLSKIHHAAFDRHLIGIDPDDRVHVSERLLMLHDGPLLEQSLKAIAGATMRLPRRRQDYPDRDRLAARLEQFKRVA